MHLRIIAAAALTLAGSTVAMGQADAATLIGQRVRIRSAVGQGFLIGTLTRVDADSAEVAEASGVRQTWALSGFDQVERSVGRRGHARGGLLMGAIVGVLIGVTGGFLAGDDPPRPCCFFERSAGDKALGYGLGLGLIGAIVGAVLGTSAQTEDWQDVSELVLRADARRRMM